MLRLFGQERAEESGAPSRDGAGILESAELLEGAGDFLPLVGDVVRRITRGALKDIQDEDRRGGDGVVNCRPLRTEREVRRCLQGPRKRKM